MTTTVENETNLIALLDVLIEQTSRGKIDWEQADARGTAFIAQRPSGTVALEGFRFATGGSSMPNPITLVVRDRQGLIVRRVDSTGLMGGLGLSLDLAQRLVHLHGLVSDQLGAADATVQKLAEEFSA
jgi:hypothetical protein